VNEDIRRGLNLLKNLGESGFEPEDTITIKFTKAEALVLGIILNITSGLQVGEDETALMQRAISSMQYKAMWAISDQKEIPIEETTGDE
jgi:hypothetical protein